MRVLVEGADPTMLRAATALASHPDIESVGLADIDPPAGWGGRIHRSEAGEAFDRVVGGPRTGLLSVTAGPEGTISYASPLGLARALATRLGGRPRLAITEPGRPSRSDRWFDFPAPVGRLLVRHTVDGVDRCPIEEELAAVGANIGERTLAVVDQSGFLRAVCLAAGVFLEPEGGPVWKQPETYLAGCELLGLVIAESIE